MVHNLDEAVKKAEMVVLLVGHNQFKTIDPQAFSLLTPARLVLDTVNGWDSKAWQEAGFKVLKLGKGQK
jgi:UDP-N-acetyl-D-mannosaminuronate dehydrogenase